MTNKFLRSAKVSAKGMVTDWKLPNSKIIRTGPLALCLLLSSCSAYNKYFKKKNTKSNEQKVNKSVTFGPTKPKKWSGFVDRTSKYGLKNQKAAQLYAVDFDHDGDTDLVVIPTAYDVPVFYRYSKPKRRFYKMNYNPFPTVQRASFLSFVDINKDGLYDILLSTLNQRTELSKLPIQIYYAKKRKGRIYYYQKKNFTSVNKKPRPTASVSALDYNLDGKLDLFVANWFKDTKQTTKPDIDKLYVGNKNSFEDKSYLLYKEDETDNARVPNFINARPTFSSSICDINWDGYPDILTGSSSGFKNKLWINEFDTKRNIRLFQDYGDKTGYSSDVNGFAEMTGGGNTFFSSCFDYNNDSFMDIFVGELSHSYDGENIDRSSILTGKNNKFIPSFIRTEYSHDFAENWSQGDRRAVWFDYNFDGFIDLLVDNSGFPPNSRLVLFKQNRDRSYQDVSEELGIDIVNPSGTVVLDVNRDGRPDIITGQTNLRDDSITPRLYVFENRVKREGRRSLKFHLRGKNSNTHAIGARVTLITNRGKYRQLVKYQEGALPSQNEEGLYFGLSRFEKPEKITVSWPYLATVGKRKRIVTKTYKLNNLKFKRFLNVTLCENGKQYIGQKKCK